MVDGATAVQRVDVATGDVVWRQQGDDGVEFLSAALWTSGDGREPEGRLALGDDRGWVHVWDAVAGQVSCQPGVNI